MINLSAAAQVDRLYYRINAFHLKNQNDSLTAILLKNISVFPDNVFLLSELVRNSKKASPIILESAKKWAEESNEANFYLAEFYAQQQKRDSAFYFLNKYFSDSHEKSQSLCVSDKKFGYLKKDKRWQEFMQKDYDYAYQKLVFDGRFEASIKKYDEALNLYDDFLQKYKNPNVYAARADILFQTRDYNSALNDYLRAYKKHKNSFYLRKIILCNTALKRPKKVIENATIYLRKNKYDLEVVELLGFANLSQKKYVLSSKYLLLYTTYIKDDKAFFALGKCYEEEANWLEALKNYSNAMKLKPYEASYRLARANIYFQTENYAVADRDYTQYLDQSPNNPEIYYKRGLCRYNLNFVQKACFDWKIAEKSGLQAAKIEYERHCTDR